MKRSLIATLAVAAAALAQIRPIHDVRRNNSQGVPELEGQSVTVTGVVTEAGHFGGWGPARVEDSTGGVALYDASVADLSVVDGLTVTGTVKSFHGLTETAPVDQPVNHGAVAEPLPQRFRIPDIGRIDTATGYVGTEGRLVGFDSVWIEHSPGELFAGDQGHTFRNSRGQAAELKIDGDAGETVGLPIPDDSIDLVGVVAQHKPGASHYGGHRLMPRARTDIGYVIVDTTIAAVQEPDPSDGVTPRLLDSVVRVRGRLTGPASSFTSGTARSLYIQDQTQGINVYACSFREDEAAFLDSIGVEWEVTGTVTEYNGLTEIAEGTMRVTDPEPRPIVPCLLPYHLPLNENMESNLLIAVGEVVEPPTLSGSGYNLSIKSGSAVIAIRIGENTGIAVSRIGRGAILRIIGIGGQYDYEEPFNSGYQLLPRFSADVRDTSAAFVLADRLVIDSISPNPFSPGRGEVAGIALTAPSDSRVTVTVLDMDGRIVRELLRESSGRMSGPLFWDGTSDLARPQPAGIYLLNVKAVRSNGRTETATQPIVVALRME